MLKNTRTQTEIDSTHAEPTGLGGPMESKPEPMERPIDTSGLGRSHADRAVRHFLETPDSPKVFGSYFIKSGTLTYRESTRGQDFRVELIAIKAKKGGFIGNSSASRFQETESNQTACQKVLVGLGVPMVPFSVFADAKLNIQEFTLVDRGPEESIVRAVPNPAWVRWNRSVNGDSRTPEPPKTIDETVHFIGASLFSVGPKYFLFDLDRVELGHKIFNPFMSEIPKPCQTIAEAYDSLIPAEVRKAKKAGLKVIRQGEWFLIPVKGKHTPDRTPKADRQWLPEFRPMTLRAGPNRPNEAEFGVQAKNLCKGKFSHSGREHKTIVLKQWHKAVPNTAVGSFTITGDVD